MYAWSTYITISGMYHLRSPTAGHVILTTHQSLAIQWELLCNLHNINASKICRTIDVYACTYLLYNIMCNAVTRYIDKDRMVDCIDASENHVQRIIFIGL